MVALEPVGGFHGGHLLHLMLTPLTPNQARHTPISPRPLSFFPSSEDCLYVDFVDFNSGTTPMEARREKGIICLVSSNPSSLPMFGHMGCNSRMCHTLPAATPEHGMHWWRARLEVHIGCSSKCQRDLHVCVHSSPSTETPTQLPERRRPILHPRTPASSERRPPMPHSRFCGTRRSDRFSPLGLARCPCPCLCTPSISGR